MNDRKINVRMSFAELDSAGLEPKQKTDIIDARVHAIRVEATQAAHVLGHAGLRHMAEDALFAVELFTAARARMEQLLAQAGERIDKLTQANALLTQHIQRMREEAGEKKIVLATGFRVRGQG